MCDLSVLRGKRVAFHTLGCKLNFAETSTLRDALLRAGAVAAGEGERADVCIVNTCSVTETADQKCRQVIHRFVRENPGAFVAVMGCYAQLKADEIARFDGVDLVLGMEHKGMMVPYLAQRLGAKEQMGPGQACHEAVAVPTRDIATFVPSCSRGDRTRYFLKVQDGCNYYCTYCTIPLARGRSRNASVASLVEQARAVAREGGKEIVLTGVNIGDFGRSTGETFYDLVRALDDVEGIERYRISSIEPNLLTDEIIDFCARSRAFMPHFHIPLQAGSDEVLRLMHRRYDTAVFRAKVEKVRSVMPDAFIGVDVMTGMRGETPELFDEAYAFIAGLDISQLHVFTYSERPGTRALDIAYTVPRAERHARSARLLALSEEKRRAFYARNVGQVRPVLWEHARPGRPQHGFTDNYVRVELPAGACAPDNAIARVRLGGPTADGEALMALTDE